MAGGTMLIVGGGALLGAIGGSGASAVTSMALATNGSCVLGKCAKLVTFCEDVLIKQCGDFASVARIHAILTRRIIELEVRIEETKQGSSNGNDRASELSKQVLLRCFSGPFCMLTGHACKMDHFKVIWGLVLVHLARLFCERAERTGRLPMLGRYPTGFPGFPTCLSSR